MSEAANALAPQPYDPVAHIAAVERAQANGVMTTRLTIEIMQPDLTASAEEFIALTGDMKLVTISFDSPPATNQTRPRPCCVQRPGLGMMRDGGYAGPREPPPTPPVRDVAPPHRRP